MERLKQEGAAWDEAMVIINHTQELLELALVRGLRKLLNGLTLRRKWGDTRWGDGVPEEGECLADINERVSQE